MAEDSSGDGRGIARWPAAFGRFWWDFLIGDTPELFVGAVVTIAVIALVCRQSGLRTTAAFILPVLVVSVVGASVWRAARKGED